MLEIKGPRADMFEVDKSVILETPDLPCDILQYIRRSNHRPSPSILVEKPGLCTVHPPRCSTSQLLLARHHKIRL